MNSLQLKIGFLALSAAVACIGGSSQGLSQCFTNTDCTGDVVPAADQHACCVDTVAGLWFSDGFNCHRCIVHGFVQVEYTILEDERLFTGFQLNVKGTTQHSGLHLIGTIVAEAGGSATDNDFERLAPIRVVNSVDISLFATNDEITLEYNDKIELKFIPDLSGLITSLEGLGEYIRNSTTVHIIDNDLLEINFEESDYSIKEGATMLSTPIRLQFRTNQNPFTVTLRPISVDVAESEKLGVFINSAAISSQSRATAVADFSDQPITVEVPANSQQYQIREFFIIEDDDVDEDMQSFAIVAEIGEDVAENISCFQLGVGSAECFGRQGATEIRITDNDPMIIGFAIKSQTISENEVPGMDIFPLLIEVGTLRTAEREHRIIFRHKESSSTATVEPLASYAKYDAIFGTREQPGDPLTEKFDLLPEHDTPLLSTFIRNDLHREEDECYTIQILPVDIPGRRELFKCNDSADADNYFCEHTICIVDDDELFVVAFERTTYMVDESVGSVNVCVNLTQPEIDILDETVNVFVIDDPSSVKIPAGATFATPDPPDFLERYTMVEKSDYAQQTNLFNAIDDVLITELKRIVCYNQTIYDDLRVEFDEYAGITLGVRDISTTAVKPMYDQASIFILDNDVAILGLEQTLFNVNENVGRVEVCAAVFSPDINCPVEFPFEVKLHTSDGTAVKMLDYEPLDVTLAFGVGEKRKCVHVNITNDTLVENDEFLTYHLRRTADLHTRIKLDPTLMDGQIKIEDDDTVLVQFIPTTYTVEEGRNDSATLTLVRSRNLRRKVNVTITPRVMTAAAEFDFRADQITITFSPGETEVKVHVSIFDDSFDEDTETFTAVLSTSDTYVQLGGNAIVSILDNDALITPNPSIYNVDEDDGNATLRLFRSGSISKESAVNITLISGTAEGGLDFVNTVITVTVLPGHAEAIAQVPIIDDSTEEDTEMFIAILSTNASNIKFGDSIVTVTIKDNDGSSGTLLPGQLPCDHVLRRLMAFADLFTHCNCVHNPEWTEWVAISHTNQLNSQCPTGGALTYQRRQRRISGNCIDNIEHNTTCDPVVIDQIIRALGLGSSGHRYGDLPSNTTQTSGSRYRRGDIADVTGCPAPPSISPPRKVCPSYTVPHNQGRRSVQESPTDDNVLIDSTFQTKSSSLPFSSTAEDLLRHKRTSMGNCHYKHVLFVIDVSGSIGGSNFNKVISALGQLVPVLCDRTKVAVMTFDHEYFIEFCFNKYDGSSCGRAHATNAICSIPYVHGTGTRYTHTSGAIQCVCNDILYNCGMVQGCQDVRVVFFTDGGANGPGGPERVCQEMDCLRCEDGIETYAIGVGNPQNIECMTNTPNMNRPWSFSNFEEFENNFHILQDMLLYDYANYPCVPP